MRILQVIDSLGRGGAERVVVTLASGQAQGHEVRLACLHDESDLAGELRGSGVEVSLLHTSPRNVAAAAWGLTRLARTWRPDVVHAHLLEATMAVGLASAGSARKIATFHNLGLAGGRRGGLRTQLARAALSAVCLSRFDVLTGVTKASAEAYKAELRLRSLPLVVNNPIDLRAIRRLSPASRPIARGIVAATELRPLVVCVAKLTWEKSHRTLLQALARIAPEHRPLVVMVGDGPLRAELTAMSAELGLDNWVNWRGALPASDVYSWLCAADVCVLSSVSEGQPVSVLEAMALGTPVLATRVGGIPELLEANRGWLVAPSDPQNFALALSQMLAEPAERERRARAAREFVERSFSLDTVLPQWEALF